MNRAIEWFAKNSVAANLLMISIIAMGIMSVFSIKQGSVSGSKFRYGSY